MEGDEESGSAGLQGILESKKQALECDHLFVVDMGLEEANSPAVTLGLRGNCCLEVKFIGSNIDLHSGCSHGVRLYPLRSVSPG